MSDTSIVGIAHPADSGGVPLVLPPQPPIHTSLPVTDDQLKNFVQEFTKGATDAIKSMGSPYSGPDGYLAGHEFGSKMVEALRHVYPQSFTIGMQGIDVVQQSVRLETALRENDILKERLARVEKDIRDLRGEKDLVEAVAQTGGGTW